MRGIKHAFSKSKQWDVSCSNGISNDNYLMHDTFALRKMPMIVQREYLACTIIRLFTNGLATMIEKKFDLCSSHGVYTFLKKS